MRDFSNFKITKGYDKYSMVGDRPTFDTVKIKKVKVPFLKENQRNVDNYRMKRNNFLRPDIQSREAVDFEKLQAQLVSEAGIKVQLGDKTLRDLFQIQEPDPSDVEWITEYNRRKAAGEDNEQLKAYPPFGRPQRTITKNVNVAQASSNVETQLASIQSQAVQNKTETLTEIQNIITGIANLAAISRNFTSLTEEQTKILEDVINRLNIPPQYKSAGLPRRLYNFAEYSKIKPQIIAFLESNIPTGLTVKTPLYSASSSKPVSITVLEDDLNKGMILDVEKRIVISVNDARDLITLKAVDSDIPNPEDILTPLAPPAPIGYNYLDDADGYNPPLGATTKKIYDKLKKTYSKSNFIGDFIRKIGTNTNIKDTFKKQFFSYMYSLPNPDDVKSDIDNDLMAEIVNILINTRPDLFNRIQTRPSDVSAGTSALMSKMIEEIVPTKKQRGSGFFITHKGRGLNIQAKDIYDLKLLRRK